MHEIVVEKALPPAPEFKQLLRPTGEGEGPSEDCGGRGGTYRLREILKNRKHPEHRELLEWNGPTGGVVPFDVVKINRGLKRLKI